MRKLRIILVYSVLTCVVGFLTFHLALNIYFEAYYLQWKHAREQGELTLTRRTHVFDDEQKTIIARETLTDLGRAYQGMRRLGDFAIPRVIGKIEGGNAEMLPLLDDLVDGRFSEFPNMDYRKLIEKRVERSMERWQQETDPSRSK